MAKFTQTGKRAVIDGTLTMSATSQGKGEWSKFSIMVQEEGNFPGNRSYRWHRIDIDRAEAARLVNYLCARLIEQLDGYGSVMRE